MTTNRNPSAQTEIIEEVEGDATTLHRVLADRRRRRVLTCLEASDTPIGLRGLAEEIAARNREGGGADSSDDVQSILIHLYHTHVPMLAAAGLVDYDEDEETVRLASTGAKLAEPMQACTP